MTIIANDHWTRPRAVASSQASRRGDPFGFLDRMLTCKHGDNSSTLSGSFSSLLLSLYLVQLSDRSTSLASKMELSLSVTRTCRLAISFLEPP